MNDRTESLYVAPGYKCTVWADNFEGKSLTFYPGWHLYHELKYEGMVDKISSVQADKAPSGYEKFAENALAGLGTLPGSFGENASIRFRGQVAGCIGRWR